MQKLIKTTCDTISARLKKKPKGPTKETPSTPQTKGTENMFQIENNFESMISTIILFIEQEPFSNVLMNLNVNFRRVQQGNFMPVEGDNFEDAIYEEEGKKFQNSPIHLVFYEMIEKPPRLTDLVPTLEEHPQLSLMTWCKLNKNLLPNLPEHAFDSDLLLVLKNITAQFVTKEKYQ